MDLPFPAEDLARLYRFALLMTGNEAVAHTVLFEACHGCSAQLGSYRNHASAFACLLENIRARAKHPPAVEGDVPGAPAPALAREFASLPEPERAALGILYAGLLPAREIAEVLKLSLEQMGSALKSARGKLQREGMSLDEETATGEAEH